MNNLSALLQDPIVSLSWQLNRSLKSRCTAGVVLLGTQAGTKPVWLIWKSAKGGSRSTEHSCTVLAIEELLPPTPPLTCHNRASAFLSFLHLKPWDGGRWQRWLSFYTTTSQASPHSTDHWIWQHSSSSKANQLFLDLSSACIMFLATPFTYEVSLSLFTYLHEFIGTNSNWFLYPLSRMSKVSGKYVSLDAHQE